MKIEDTLRQVLEALVLGRAMYNPISTTWGTIDDAITSVYKTIENIQPKEPEQEPVAWTLIEELEKGVTTTNAHLWFTNPKNSSWTPLYTTPPQRKPLTDEEIYEIGFDLNIGGIQTMKAYKAIEAKLKEKNT